MHYYTQCAELWLSSTVLCPKEIILYNQKPRIVSITGNLFGQNEEIKYHPLPAGNSYWWEIHVSNTDKTKAIIGKWKDNIIWPYLPIIKNKSTQIKNDFAP